MKTVICNKCGWAHFEVTKQYAEDEVKQSNEYLASLSPDVFNEYYGGHFSSLDKYKSCFGCGEPFTNFHIATENDDVPMGVTMQAILCKDEK